MKYKIPKTKYIDRVGVEIEGLWDNDVRNLKARAETINGWRKDYSGFIQHDGSINIYSRIALRGIPAPRMSALEVTTPPLNLRNTLKAIGLLTTKLASTNSTCGFHIHLSFKDTDNYLRLTSPQFMPSFVKEMGIQFPETKPRQTTHYCQGSYVKGLEASDIQNQFRDTLKRGTRYRAVNFAYALHGTIEFRLFPASSWASDKDIFQKYVLATVSFVENYLDATPKKNIIVEKVATTDDLYATGELKVLTPLVA